MTAMQPERFAAMGTRVELHLFGLDDRDALLAARRAIEAVDDALTIHRPSATTALNERLMAGRPCRIDDPVLLDALIEIEAAYAATHGLFDPAADASRPGVGWNMISFDRDNARIEASRPVALDFGGFGKGFALDRACEVLRGAGVPSAFLCAGESSIAVVGEHPLGGGWPVAVPHPLEPGRFLAEFELRDEALSISSTVGAGAAAPERAAMIRPTDTSVVTAPRTTVAIDRSGARAEVMSTALLVADDDRAGYLLDCGRACSPPQSSPARGRWHAQRDGGGGSTSIVGRRPPPPSVPVFAETDTSPWRGRIEGRSAVTRRFLFDFSREAAMPVQPNEMALQ